MNKKKMSFAKLMLIFVISFIAFIILSVVVMKAISGQKSNKKVVTQVHQPQFQPPQQQQDILVEQLRLEQANAREISTQQVQTIQEQNQVIVQQLNTIASSLNSLNQRVIELENSRQKIGIQIIKPEYKPRVSTVKQLEKGTTPLSSNTGYQVKATVGKRAWISTGVQEDSVTLDETLPRVHKPFVVRGINNESGIVIISTTRDEKN